MNRSACHLLGPFVLALFLLPLASPPASAQDSQSAALAKQLTDLMDAQKLDCVAAKDSSQADVYIAALYFPGQLMVVSAKYSVPVLLNEKLAKKDYKEIYMDLNSASDPKTKILIMDLGADGLKAKVDGNKLDTFEQGGKTRSFDGDWKAQKISEEEYMKGFADADARYSKMLQALIGQLKRTS
jgi:uncharacterized lipoprotein YajG